MGTKLTTTSVVSYNASPPSDDGSATAANQVFWSTIKTKLGDPLNTFAAAIDTKLTTALDTSSRKITTSDSTVAGDHWRTIEIGSTVSTGITVSLGDAASMAAGYMVTVNNQCPIAQTIGRVTSANSINGTVGNVSIPALSSMTFKVNGAVTGYMTDGVGSAAAPLTVLRTYLSGLTYSNNGTDNIDIAAGVASDSTNAATMTGAASTKNITTAWAVGSGQGMLDTGAVGNSDYYLWVIQRVDTGVVDYLASLSSTAPTMPANYTLKRLFGWFKRVGGVNVAFHTYETEGGGIEQNWDVPTLDINLANTLTTSRRTDAVKVPLNFSVEAHINAVVLDAAVAGFAALICCPDQTDAAPSATAAPLLNLYQTVVGSGHGAQLRIRTSATGTIAARATIATVDSYCVSTMGFKWARRN